jgi:hypothetical protein
MILSNSLHPFSLSLLLDLNERKKSVKKKLSSFSTHKINTKRNNTAAAAAAAAIIII